MVIFRNFCFNKLLANLIGLSVIVGFLVMVAPQMSFADDSFVLTVKGNGVEKEVRFSMADLQALPQVTYNYSGYNHWPSLQIFKNITAPTLKSILDVAGLKDNATLIRIKSPSGIYMDFTKVQLLDTPRYYFPTGEDPSDLGKWPPTNRSEEGKVPVETILAINTANGKLLFGQETPLDPVCCKSQQLEGLLPGGTIEVTTDPLEQWGLVSADHPSGTVVPGTEVALKHVFGEPDNILIYYTLDGSEPTIKSNIYNISYPNFQPQLNAPIPINGDTTIKARTIGMGKLDGEVATYQYNVGSLACTIEGGGLSESVSYAVETLKGMTPVEGSYQYSEQGETVSLTGKGVLLSTLLDELDVSNLWEVKFVAASGEEYSGGTVQEVKSQQCMLAYEVNGEEVADVSGEQTVYIQILRNLNSDNLLDNRLKYVNAIKLIDVEDKVTISSVELSDYQGGQITSVEAGGGYCIQAQLINNVDAAKDTLLVIQVRTGAAATTTSGGSVVGYAAMQTVVDTSGGEYKAEFTMPFGLSGKAYIDVFVWDNCDSLESLGKDNHELSFDIT